MDSHGERFAFVFINNIFQRLLFIELALIYE